MSIEIRETPFRHHLSYHQLPLPLSPPVASGESFLEPAQLWASLSAPMQVRIRQTFVHILTEVSRDAESGAN